MEIFSDNMYTEEEVERIKTLYLEIGWLLKDIDETDSDERKRWFHIYIKKTFNEDELKHICRALKENLPLGYRLTFNYEIDETYDIIYARREYND